MPDLAARAAKIELLLLDVDGVLTDGGIVYTDDGMEIKRFHVRDGSGLKFWHSLGKRSAIVSGRTSPAVERRAAELGIAPVFQGCADKLPAPGRFCFAKRVFARNRCARSATTCRTCRCCGGAGWRWRSRMPARRCGPRPTTSTPMPGGRGAVREAVEWLLKLQGQWDRIVAGFHR